MEIQSCESPPLVLQALKPGLQLIPRIGGPTAQFIGFLVTQLEQFLVEVVGIKGLSAFLSRLEGN